MTRADKPFRMPVQWVNRPHSDFRGFAGTVASGSIKTGRRDCGAAVGADRDRQAMILGPGGEQAQAAAGDAVTVTLGDDVDVARGDMLAPLRDRPQVADQFAAHLVWMSEEQLLPGRSYLIKINHCTLTATVTELKHRIDVNTLAKLAAKTLALNEVGVCNLSVARAAALRSLCRQPRHRRLHPDRPLFQRDGRRRHDRFRVAARDQYPSADHHREQERARATHASPAGGAVVYRPAGRRQIDHRQSGRSGAACARRAHAYCSTATMCATASTRISASPRPTGWRTSAASARSPS